MYPKLAIIAGVALAVASSSSFAQQPPPNGTPITPQAGTQANSSQQPVSQDEVRRDLAKAGYSDIEFLETAYVVRATNSNGTRLIMTITPQEVRAIEFSPNRPGGGMGQPPAPSVQNSGAGVPGQAGNKSGPPASGRQANDNQAPQQSGMAGAQDTAKIPGKPGGKSGQAVMPPSGEPR